MTMENINDNVPSGKFTEHCANVAKLIAAEWLSQCPGVRMRFEESHILQMIIATTLEYHIDLMREVSVNMIDDISPETIIEMQLIGRLREREGNSVTILCDNPEGPPNSAVICNGDWTGYLDRRFEGERLLDALHAAFKALCAFDDAGEEAPSPPDMKALYGLPLVGDEMRGALALALTRTRVLDMPTARAIIDNALNTNLEYTHGQIVRGRRDNFKGRVIGYYLTIEGGQGLVLQELGTRIKHIYDVKHIIR